MKRVNTIIIVLSVLLLIAVVYIGYGFYDNVKIQGQNQAYQVGAQVGYEQAISQIVQMAASCQQVPLKVDNQTINIIAVEC